jgi:hypothetical protein
MGMLPYVQYFENIKNKHLLDKPVWIGYVCSADKGCDFLELMASHQGFQPTVIDCSYFANLINFQNAHLDGQKIMQYSILSMIAYVQDRVEQKILSQDPTPMLIMNNYSHLSNEQRTLFVDTMKQNENQVSPFYMALLSSEDFEYSFSQSFLTEQPQYLDYYDIQELPVLEKIESERKSSLPYQKQCEVEMTLIEQLKHQILIKMEPTLQATVWLEHEAESLQLQSSVKKGWSILKKWL